MTLTSDFSKSASANKTDLTDAEAREAYGSLSIF